jgi:small subunit ribosomal protein S1
LLHVSELADHKVENPEDVVKVGEVIEVKVLRVDPEERKIGLSRKRVEWAEAAEIESAKAASASRTPPQELRGGVGSSTGPLIKPIHIAVEQPQQPDSPDNPQQ